jgi:hypothetical protein
MPSSTRISHRWRSIGGTALALCVTTFGWCRWPRRWSLALLILATVMFVVALLWPRAWAPIQAGLDRAARGLTAVVTWILLGAVFAVCFLPGRLLLALLRRDPLHRAWQPGRTSYWEPLPRSDDAGRFRRQY